MSNFELVKSGTSQPDRIHGAALSRIGGDGFPEKVFGGQEGASGPVLLDVTGQHACVTVQVDDGATHPAVRVFTRSVQAEVVRAVKNTRIERSGHTLTVEIPVHRVAPTVIQGGGNVYVGRNISFMSTGGGTTVIGGSSESDAVLVEVTLPSGSGVRSDLTSGDLRVTGSLSGLETYSSSGDTVVKGSVGKVRASASSGDLELGRVTEGAEITTSSGAIWIGQYEGNTLRLNASSGAISVGVAAAASGLIRVRTSSGAISVTGTQGRDVAHGGNLDIKLSASSGKIRRS